MNLFPKLTRHQLRRLVLLGHSLGTLPEAIAVSPSNKIQVPHSASPSGLPPAGLDGPVVFPYLGSRVATRGTNLLLDVKCNLSTATAQCVRLITPFSKGAGSLGHGEASHFSCRSESSNN